MIIEIFLIILSLLIPVYGIYKCSGDEEPYQQINVGDVQNDVINHLNINNEPRDNNNNNNNILNDNENNDTIFFKNHVIATIQRKEEKKNIDWGDLETTASDIEKSLTYEAKSMVQDTLAEIKEILNEEKLKRGEEVVKRWIDKNKGKGDVKKWIDINSGFFIKEGFAEILKLIYNSEENTYMFKNFDTDKKEKKRLLTGFEIICFLKKIKVKLPVNISDGDFLALKKREFKKLEIQAQIEEEKKRKEEEKRKKYDEEVKDAKNILGPEPDIKTPGVCFIKIISADRERSWERRFLKDDTISTLYFFAKSLGREIFMEPDATDFDILAGGFPPKNLENSKNNTLEQEGLFPKAEVQIKEKYTF